MPAYISRPAVTVGPHQVTTPSIITNISQGLDNLVADRTLTEADGARLWRQTQSVVNNCGVDTRYWMRSLEETATRTSVGDRARTAFDESRRHAAQAAHEALHTAGLTPDDVDCIITSHTSSWSVPSLDVALVYDLGLRPDVTRQPLATLACAGGAQALIRAAHHITANPDHTVLVVVAEQLSTIYHQDETTIESMIYKVLFGDSAAACVVTGNRRGPGMCIEATWEHVLPDSANRYWGRIDTDGLHFDSTRAAARAARDTVPHIQDWLDGRELDWAVVHPGGPAIIRDVTTGVGLDDHEKAGRHSYASLREYGNLGGAAVLDVLRRTHDDPPAIGAPGLMVAFGPGFVTSGLRGVWC